MSNYDFSTLSPYDFELLVGNLLNAEIEVPFESFRRGPDGGVDLRYFGHGQKIIVQCKHYGGSTYSDLKKAVYAEVPKIERERPTRYIFATSMELSRKHKDEIFEALHPWIKASWDLMDRPTLNALLQRHPDVERKHFKLWLASTEVLDRIVHSGAWQRSQAMMDQIKNKVKLYVSTDSYLKAHNLLEDKNVVVITGPPGVGKSMLAHMLCLARWESGWQIVDIPSHRIDDAWDLALGDRKQAFLFDDVFGQTDITEQIGRGAGASLSKFAQYVSHDPSKRLIITSRLQLLKMAQQRDDSVRHSQLALRQCVLEVSEFTKVDRARVLYNHLYFSKLPREVLEDFVRQGRHHAVISDPSFSPRIIEQIVLYREFASAASLGEALLSTFKNQAILWQGSFSQSLDSLGRAILLQLAAFPVEGAPPESLRDRVIGTVEPLIYAETFSALEGTWIKVGQDRPWERVRAQFNDPSCRDFVLQFLEEHPAYLGSVLSRAASRQETLTLLNYAISTTPQGSKTYPAYGSWIINNKRTVAEQIRSTWPAELGKKDDIVSRLAAVHELEAAFGLGLFQWALETTYEIVDVVEEQERIVDSSSTKLVFENLVKGDRLPANDGETAALLELFDNWCMFTSDELDWDGVASVMADIDAVPGREELWESLRSIFENRIRGWLDNELSELNPRSAEPEELHSVLDGLKSFLSGYLTDSDYISAIESKRSDFEEYQLEYEPSYEEKLEMRYSARAIAEHGHPEESDTTSHVPRGESEDEYISSIFGQLKN